jgi:hypothetical protein
MLNSQAGMQRDRQGTLNYYGPSIAPPSWGETDTPKRKMSEEARHQISD